MAEKDFHISEKYNFRHALNYFSRPEAPINPGEQKLAHFCRFSVFYRVP
jgi:hypothetical protein